MPVTVQQQAGLYRVVEASTGRLARNAGGTPVDGGGHASKNKAGRQARAVNRSLSKKKGKT